jgi:hypothetical protein
MQEDNTISYTNSYQGRFIDSVLWLCIPILLFGIPIIGAVSGDAIAHSENFKNSKWVVNPNHLFFETFGALWHNSISIEALKLFNIERSGPDRLLLLSLFSGALALGIFRYMIPLIIPLSRFYSNISTLIVGSSSAFLKMLLSGEHFMIIYPFLTLFLITTYKYLATEKFASTFASAISGALATLCMISHALLIALTGIAFFIYGALCQKIKKGITFLTCLGTISLAIIVVVLVCTYLMTKEYTTTNAAEGISFLQWLSSYRGGSQSRESLAYGIQSFSLSSLVISGIRALYGSISAIVDVQILFQVIRDKLTMTAPLYLQVIAVLALLFYIFILCLWVKKTVSEKSTQNSVLIVFIWIVSTLIFGTLWNNSDDQFYFHLALALGLLSASFFSTRNFQKKNSYYHTTALICICCFVMINLFDACRRLVFFPRERQVMALDKALHEAHLIVMPGANNSENMSWFIRPSIQDKKITLFQLSNQYTPVEGLKILKQKISETLQQKKKVFILDIYDTPPQALPWKHLELVGYTKKLVLDSLAEFKTTETSKFIEGYSLREILN